MRFDSHPVNLEAVRGPEGALRLQVTLADVPAGATNIQVWAARLPETLSPDTLASLATGALSLASVTGRTQAGAWDGLRALSGPAVTTGGPVTAIEGQLFESAYDMALAGWGAPSSADTVFDPSLERSDQFWFLAATCLDAGNNAVVARGGLGQWAGQEHLAGVWLSPSNFAGLVQLADLLVNLVRSFKPLLDWRIAQTRPPGSDWAIASVRLTDEEKTDEKLSILIMPQRASISGAGLGAPDRRMEIPVFNIRVLCYADDVEARQRTLLTLADSLRALLNTRKLRELILPDGNPYNLALVSNLAFGKTQDSYADAVDITYSCQSVTVGIV